MNEMQQEQSPTKTWGELRALLNDYARQETVDPLKDLARWVAFGLAGALAVSVGLGYLAFGLLRALQDLDEFQGNGSSWAPYMITFGGLILCVQFAVRAIRRRSSNGEA